MTKKKRMTIEDLARIIQNDVVSQMATKDDIAQIIQRLDGHDHRLQGVDQRLDGVEQRLDEHGRRLDRIEGHVADIRVTQGHLVTILTSKRILTAEETRGLSSA